MSDPDILEVKASPSLQSSPSPRFVEDLAGIEKRGVLRVLVQGHGEDLLPRDGSSSRLDRDLVEEFALRRGLSLEVVTVRVFDDLLPALLAGEGDVIAGRLTVTAARKKRIAFSRPYQVVDEVLTGPALPPPTAVPATIAQAVTALAGRPVAVLQGSAHEETLDAAAGMRPAVVRVNDDRDEHDLAQGVARGEVAATVLDSDVLAHVRAYNPGVVPWVTLKTGRELALGLRKENPQLKAALDAFLVERALTSSRHTTAALDWEGVKKRGSLRVLTKNDDVSYFLKQGEQRGFDHDFLALFAAEHGLRLEVVVPPDPDALCAWLEQGRGDVVAALLPAPGCGSKTTASFAYVWPDLLLLQPVSSSTSLPKRVEGVARPEELQGAVLHAPSGLAPDVRAQLGNLAARLGFSVAWDAPEDVMARVDAVASGALPFSVLASPQAGVLSGRYDVRGDVVLGRETPRVLATRASASTLSRTLAAFVSRHSQEKPDGKISGSTDYNLLRKRYLSTRLPPSRTRSPVRALPRSSTTSTTLSLSPFDALLQHHAARVGLDWRLLAAQAFQESRFDPKAQSAAGALGLFQFLPSTGRELGYKNLHDPEEGTAAGASYMAWLLEQFEPTLAFKNRVRFALASYNAGKGHVDDARKLARTMGLDPDRWFKNVEVAMAKLADPRIARTTRYGYCRGSEPVAYVSEITTRYENYTSLVGLLPSSSSAAVVAPAPKLR